MAAPASRPFYASPAWRALRSAALERDGFLCVVPGCGKRATHVDHIARRPHVATPTALMSATAIPARPQLSPIMRMICWASASL